MTEEVYKEFASGLSVLIVQTYHKKISAPIILASLNHPRDILESPEFKESFLSSASAITVGFDDGDLDRVK